MGLSWRQESEGRFINFLRQSLGFCIAHMALAVKDPIQKLSPFQNIVGFTLRNLVAEQAIKIFMDAVNARQYG